VTHRAGTRRTGLSLAPTRARALALGLGLASAAPNVFAHGAIKGIGNFGSGFVHPLVEPAHLIALLALALLFGQRGVLTLQRALLALSVAVALGLVGAASGWPGATESLLLVLAGAVGLAVVIARPLPPMAYLVAAGVIGLGIGLGTSHEGMKGGAYLAAMAGTWLGASFCTLSAATFIGEAKRPWMQILVRVAASWITASAVLVLALRLSGRG